MPGHTFLYSPPVVLVKEMIDRGDLGEIYFVSSSRVNLGLHQADVSVVWDLGPHDFSILRYWLGESPETVSALCRACVIPGMPDVAFVNMRYASGTIAQIELAWLAPSKLRRTAIVGSERMVVYDDTSGEPVRVFNSGASLPDPESFGEYQLSYRTGDIVSPRVEPVEPLYRQMEDFCRAVRDGAEPRSSATIGRRGRRGGRGGRPVARRRTVPRSMFGRRALRVARNSSSSGARQHALIESLPPARSARSGLEGPSRSMLGLMLVADGHEVRTEPWA